MSVVGNFNPLVVVLKWADEISPKDCDHLSSKFIKAVRDSFPAQHVKKQTPNVLDISPVSKT